MELLNFFKPNNLEETKDLLANYDNSKLLAGGTDLVLELKRDKENPQHIIDLGKLTELKTINVNENEVIIGSMVTFTEVMINKFINYNFNSLTECAKNMGSPQIRNIATIGGNIANAGSAADVVPCIISLGGTLVIESINGTRYISCEDYFTNYSTEKIKKDEILTKIIIPIKGERSGYYKLGKRNALAIARVSTAISIDVENDIVKSISMCLGAVGRYPFKAKVFENEAVGKSISWLSSEEPLKLLENEVYESIKGRKTMPFKKEAIKGVYKEALRTALAK